MAGTSTSADAGRERCGPCRGTGRVLSGLGGETHEVVCSWCGGTGRFQRGRDAQESPSEQGQETARP